MFNYDNQLENSWKNNQLTIGSHNDVKIAILLLKNENFRSATHEKLPKIRILCEYVKLVKVTVDVPRLFIEKGNTPGVIGLKNFQQLMWTRLLDVV